MEKPKIAVGLSQLKIKVSFRLNQQVKSQKHKQWLAYYISHEVADPPTQKKKKVEMYGSYRRNYAYKLRSNLIACRPKVFILAEVMTQIPQYLDGLKTEII